MKSNFDVYYHRYIPEEMVKSFDSIYIQKHYADKKSFSLVCFDVDLDGFSDLIKDREKILTDFLMLNDIFRFLFDVRTKTFIEVNKIYLPYITGTSDDAINETELCNYIHLNKNILLYFIFYNTSKNKFTFWISHYIFDLSCVELFKRKFFSFIKRKNIKRSYYSEFLDYINAKNKKFNLNNNLLNLLNVQKVMPNYINEKQIFYLKLEYIKKENPVGISQRVGYIISELLAEETGCDTLSGSYILNQREISDLDITQTLGCVLSVVPFVYIKGDTYSSYLKRNRKFIDLSKDGIYFKQLSYRYYPNQEDSIEYNLFEVLPSISVNFMGFISSIQEAIKDVESFRCATRPNKSRIYTSVFYYQGELYVFFVNYLFQKEFRYKEYQLYKYY